MRMRSSTLKELKNHTWNMVNVLRKQQFSTGIQFIFSLLLREYSWGSMEYNLAQLPYKNVNKELVTN